MDTDMTRLADWTATGDWSSGLIYRQLSLKGRRRNYSTILIRRLAGIDIFAFFSACALFIPL